MKRRTLRIIAAAMAACLLAACTKGVIESPTTAAVIEKTAPAEAEWAVYWYLCGSNLESGNQSASNDLSEILSEKLPKDAKVVIQTGGSRSWHSKGITADGMMRFTAENGKLSKQEKLPLQNMGTARTLSDFITYCLTEHPAKHTMLVMWDHGGGTLGGVSYDMNYNMDSIMLPELKEALATALPDGKKLDIIGFDACLMSTIDMVEACLGHADYVLSSQQLEPVCGWDYKALAGELKNAGSLTPEALGKAICDAYYVSCGKEGLAEIATLSLIDLNTAEGVVWHYDEMIKTMFDGALQSDEKAASIRRAAYSSENYGANGRDIGYTDMVDLKGFASSMEEFAGEAFLSLIDSAVVYQVRGELSPEGCGISCYYPLDASLRSVIQYTQAAGSNEDVSLFFKYMLSPEYDGAVEAYAGEQNVTKAMREMRYVASELDLGDVEKAVLTMDSKESNRLSDVKVAANRMSKENNKYSWSEQGEVPCSSADYEGGKFEYDGEFKNVYGDDSPFATYVYSRDGNIVRCYSPAVIDGEDAFLLFTGNTETGEVISNGVVLGQNHVEGRYNPTGVKISDEDLQFTDEELKQFRKEFGRDGTPEEKRNYILSERAVKNKNFASSTGKTPNAGEIGSNTLFIANRVDPLKKDQVVTPLFKCSLTDTPVKKAEDDGNAGWQEGQLIVIGEKTKFQFKDPGEGLLFNFTVTDAWGNEKTTGSFEASKDEEPAPAEHETTTAAETEAATEPVTEPASTTAAPTTPAPTTAAPTVEPTLPASTEAPTTSPVAPTQSGGGNGSGGNYENYDYDDDDDEPETGMTAESTTAQQNTTEATVAPTSESGTTAPETTQAICGHCGNPIIAGEEQNHEALSCNKHFACEVSEEEKARHNNLLDCRRHYGCEEGDHVLLSCGEHYACQEGYKLPCAHCSCKLLDDGKLYCSEECTAVYIRCEACGEILPDTDENEYGNPHLLPCGQHYICKDGEGDEHTDLLGRFRDVEVFECMYDSSTGLYNFDVGEISGQCKKCEHCKNLYDPDPQVNEAGMHVYDAATGTWSCTP
ncbi:MAG: clostripain-related cysteine peptidase [Lachnospiraceae bacterium]|nr:clostripain-related cysteine peptidase [Lachnospiraceae bacterium]